MSKPRFSIIIPVYNEEAIVEINTRKLFGYLSDKGLIAEVILACNGCDDNTFIIIDSFKSKFPHLKVLDIPGKGVGRAFRKGVDASETEKIVSLDMDLTVDLDFIEKAVKLLDDYDFVVGSKIMGEQRRGRIRLFGSMMFIKMAEFLLNIHYNDYSPSAKAFRKGPLAKKLNFNTRDHGTSYVFEYACHVKHGGISSVQIPVDCDDHRKSKFNLIDEGVYRYRHLFRMFWKYRKHG